METAPLSAEMLLGRQAAGRGKRQPQKQENGLNRTAENWLTVVIPAIAAFRDRSDFGQALGVDIYNALIALGLCVYQVMSERIDTINVNVFNGETKHAS